MLKLKKKVKSGNVHSSTVVKSSQTKEELHRDESDEPIGDIKPGPCAVVKFEAGLTMSRNFQSVTVKVGVEMPFSIAPGKVRDLHPCFERIESIVEEKLAEKVDGIEKLLRELR